MVVLPPCLHGSVVLLPGPLPQEDLKKKQRAERFGIAVPISKEEFEVRAWSLLKRS